MNRIQIRLAIKRTPHFGLRSALAPALNFGGVRMAAPVLALALPITSKNQYYFRNFLKNVKKKISSIID